MKQKVKTMFWIYKLTLLNSTSVSIYTIHSFNQYISYDVINIFRKIHILVTL